LKQRQEVIASYSAARWAATTGAGFDAPWQHEYTLVHGEPFPQLPNDAPVITPPWDDDDNAAPAAIITDPDPDPKPPTPAAIRLPLPRTRDTAYSYHILKIAKRNGHLSLLLGSLSLRGLQVQAHIHSQALWKRGKKCPPEELLAFYYAITRMQACEVAA
jgi:hypothetical protein